MGAQKRLGPVHSPVVSRILSFFKGVLGRHAFFVFSCLTVFQASSGTTYVPIRFFLFLWALGGEQISIRCRVCRPGYTLANIRSSVFLSLRFVFSCLTTFWAPSSYNRVPLLVCGFLWVLSAHLRCDSHHSRQRTVFVSVARTNTLSSVPCWAVLNPSSGRTHVTPLAPRQEKK